MRTPALPALVGAKSLARATQCASQLRQIGLEPHPAGIGDAYAFQNEMKGARAGKPVHPDLESARIIHKRQGRASGPGPATVRGQQHQDTGHGHDQQHHNRHQRPQHGTQQARTCPAHALHLAAVRRRLVGL